MISTGVPVVNDVPASVTKDSRLPDEMEKRGYMPVVSMICSVNPCSGASAGTCTQ